MPPSREAGTARTGGQRLYVSLFSDAALYLFGHDAGHNSGFSQAPSAFCGFSAQEVACTRASVLKFAFGGYFESLDHAFAGLLFGHNLYPYNKVASHDANGRCYAIAGGASTRKWQCSGKRIPGVRRRVAEAGRAFGSSEEKVRVGWLRAKLGLFGFVFGFGGWLRKALLIKRLGRFFASRGGANRAKLALFGFVLSCVTKCPIGRKFLFYMIVCSFDFLKNWLCFFK